MLGPYDILLAAQAIDRELILVTADTDEYARISELDWVDWR
jgi:predicted nucleic acid-binding protein